MKASAGYSRTLRFGVFELDLRSGELHKHGRKIRLQEQPFQILAMLLERPGEVVTREELRHRLWPSDTFVDFDHGLNNAINRLREVLGDSADNARYVETLPRRGYRFVAPVEGASESPPPLRIESIAVLPLENLTADPSQDYFADGMTDALITNLAQISALRVISRTSVMQYKGGKKSLPEIARELNVEAVVEGSVLRSGERVRINAQLIHAATDRHLWADKYERDLRDVLTLQSEVAQAIAAEIRIKVTPQEQARLASARPVHPEVYDAYLRGRFHWNKRTEEGLRKGLEYFRQSIEKDSSYALGYAGVAECHNMLGFWGLLPPNEVYPAAKAAATKALEIDETLAEAHTALAWPMFVYDWDWAGAARELERAVELSPGYATGYQWRAHYFTYLGRHTEALAQVKRTLELDPVSLVMNSNAAFMNFLAREFDQAMQHAQRALELDPTFAPPHLFLGRVYEQKQMFGEAVAEFEKAIMLSASSPVMLAALGHAYAAWGKRSEAQKVLKELRDLSGRRYVSSYYIAMLHAGLGEREQALIWLEKAYQERSAWLVMIKVEPGLDILRVDPRFQEMLRGIGLPP